MTWEEWLNSSYSDGWSYKSQILTYDEANSLGKFSYYPWKFGKMLQIVFFC